jgi:hypothetical protein
MRVQMSCEIRYARALDVVLRRKRECNKFGNGGQRGMDTRYQLRNGQSKKRVSLESPTRQGRQSAVATPRS